MISMRAIENGLVYEEAILIIYQVFFNAKALMLRHVSLFEENFPIYLNFDLCDQIQIGSSYVTFHLSNLSITLPHYSVIARIQEFYLKTHSNWELC